jgi:hypothetical protein
VTINALVAGRFCRQSSSTAATADATPAAAAGPPPPPPPPSLALLPCRSLVLSLSYHCAALSSSHRAGWLLHRLLLHCPFVVLSPCRPLVVLLRLVVALPPITPPSHPLIVPPSRPFIFLSLHRPLVVSSHRLVVALPLVVPLSCHPLAPPLSRRLAQAGCCVNSRHAALSSSRCATPSSSHHPITALPSHRLIVPAGCCVNSHCSALSSSSHCAALLSSCIVWLLHCLPSRRPLVLSSCLPLIISSSHHCATLLLSHLNGWLLHRLSLYRLLVVLLLCRSLVVLPWLVVASTLIAPPSRPLVVPPPRLLIVLSLRCPLVISLCRLVIASPLIAPPSCHPLTALPSCRLAPAGCCVNSRRVTLSSSRRAVLMSGRCAPAVCCVAPIKRCRRRPPLNAPATTATTTVPTTAIAAVTAAAATTATVTTTTATTAVKLAVTHF